MTKQRQWTARRGGQQEAPLAIAQVLERQSDETVQQIADALIEDSPYQARQTSADDESLAELAQGMREAGFQGILIVRPHPQRVQHNVFQLVYGHRRRLAWRLICAERGVPCIFPVVIRAYTDEQTLTIGAQENLQRRDLNPVEEAQLVVWHQELYWDKSQFEIAAMLGKSLDWVKKRSQVAQLPEELKAWLCQRPRAMSQILEVARLPDQSVACDLAERVVREDLTLETVRQIVRSSTVPKIQDRDEVHNQCGAALVVKKNTNKTALARETQTIQTILKQWKQRCDRNADDADAIYAAVQDIITTLKAF